MTLVGHHQVPSRVFLLRMWPVQRKGLSDWLIILVDVATGQEMHFAHLSEFIHYFLQEMQYPSTDQKEVTEQ